MICAGDSGYLAGNLTPEGPASEWSVIRPEDKGQYRCGHHPSVGQIIETGFSDFSSGMPPHQDAGMTPFARFPSLICSCVSSLLG
jgi:hypothetical protein